MHSKIVLNLFVRFVAGTTSSVSSVTVPDVEDNGLEASKEKEQDGHSDFTGEPFTVSTLQSAEVVRGYT